MKALYESFSGERGIFNREGCHKKIEQYGKRDPNHEWGANPCLEVTLRPNQMCNLSEIVIRPDDTLASLKKKAEIAAIFGTLQVNADGLPLPAQGVEEQLRRGATARCQPDRHL